MNIQTQKKEKGRHRKWERSYINNSSAPITKKVSRSRSGSHKAPHIIPFIQSPPHHLPPQRPSRPNHQHTRRPHRRPRPQIHRRSAAPHHRRRGSFWKAVRGQFFGRSERGWNDTVWREDAAPREWWRFRLGMVPMWIETACSGQLCWELRRHCWGKNGFSFSFLVFWRMRNKKRNNRCGFRHVGAQSGWRYCQLSCRGYGHLLLAPPRFVFFFFSIRRK